MSVPLSFQQTETLSNTFHAHTEHVVGVQVYLVLRKPWRSLSATGLSEHELTVHPSALSPERGRTGLQCLWFGSIAEG